ncbi:MAG: hypothetical protein PHT40_03280 [Patescibacteria group bacterium]|nr:hypothetical protein [Patescibacteria group bacterium]
MQSQPHQRGWGFFIFLKINQARAKTHARKKILTFYNHPASPPAGGSAPLLKRGDDGRHSHNSHLNSH